MNKKAKIPKLNNQGSTFVMAIIIITLVTTLAVAIMAASAHNIAMKNVDRNAKATFYTAETVMDEIRAGVGLDSMNQLGRAYEEILTNIVREDLNGYSYIVDNETANEDFKSIFVERMLDIITAGMVEFGGNDMVINADPAAMEYIIEYLQGFIKGYDEGMAKVTSVGGIEGYKASDTGITYYIIIRDMSVAYKEQKGGETYFSNVTADLEVSFPNMTVDFSSSNSLNDFTQYALIADDNLTINGCTANVTASIYAGGMISVKSNDMGGGNLNLSSVGTLDGEPANVICGGNTEETAGTIKVTGDSDIMAALTASGVNIWCTNLVTSPVYIGSADRSKGARIDIDELCNTYVKDDLTINGQKSKVDIEGCYYGYSYDGASSLHADSSAIIINGKGARLNIGTRKMLLGGHAYVELGRTDYYMTGEAISFKGDQEIYLIPADYLGENYGSPVPNPMPEATWDSLVEAAEDNPEVSICDMAGFFAYEQGYLAAKPYTAIRANGLVYVYLNFSSKDAAADYVYDVANGKNGAPATLKALLDRYTESLFETEDGESYVVKSDGAQIYTKGALLTTWGMSAGTMEGAVSSQLGGLVGADSSQPLSNDEFVLTSMDLKNRYEILTHLLADIPWEDGDLGDKYIVNDIDSALWQKKNYLVNGNEMSTSSMFDVIIDRQYLASNEYNNEGAYIQYGDVSKNYIKIAVNSDYRIPPECDGGIVIATGDVEVLSDFDGMIIAGGSIKVTGHATVSTNAAMIEYLISNETGYVDSEEVEAIPFREYFYAYKHVATDDDSREQVKVETVDYKDIVNYNNWRKYED